ncbi:hypothetical protein Pmgp_01263 [Pelotomaculum propionicicum]|uniref:Uncharacterized protein n=1 Tax=Pelotomaculum propionicicum TaxID=258475 RepID=A0A4Y7RT18_9FIRM|nr:hypothetical protein Pmgp_01263 [Pelotomaculum propionicicum]
MLKQTADSVDAAVEVVLNFVEVAFVFIGNLRRNVALGNTVDIFSRHVKRSDDSVHGVVDTSQDLAPDALRPVGVSPLVQFPFAAGADYHAYFVNQNMNHANAGVKVVLDYVEVTFVLIRNLRRRVAFGDAVHIFRRHVERPDNPIHGVVNAPQDLAPDTLRPVGVGPLVQFPFAAGADYHAYFVNQRVNSANQRVQVVLYFIKVALVLVRNFRRRVAFGDPVDIFRRHVQRPDNRVQHLVDTVHQVFVIPAGGHIGAG